jgi:hypothetical protein
LEHFQVIYTAYRRLRPYFCLCLQISPIHMD